jgi:hypothetical protein
MSESEWARSGLDAWVEICDCAAELGVAPRELVQQALKDHVRVRSAIAALCATSSAILPHRDPSSAGAMRENPSSHTSV